MKNKSAFTLIELMIVIVMIGLIAAMVIPAVQKVKENSIRKRLELDPKSVSSEERYWYRERTKGKSEDIKKETEKGIEVESRTLSLNQTRFDFVSIESFQEPSGKSYKFYIVKDKNTSILYSFTGDTLTPLVDTDGRPLRN